MSSVSGVSTSPTTAPPAVDETEENKRKNEASGPPSDGLDPTQSADSVDEPVVIPTQEPNGGASHSVEEVLNASSEVEALYNEVLKRDSDPAGLEYWTQAHLNGVDVRDAMLRSPEKQELDEATAEIEELFMSQRGGLPDEDTINDLSRTLMDGQTVEDIAASSDFDTIQVRAGGDEVSGEIETSDAMIADGAFYSPLELIDNPEYDYHNRALVQLRQADEIYKPTEQSMADVTDMARQLTTGVDGSPKLMTTAEVSYLAAMTLTNVGDDGESRLVTPRATEEHFDAATEGFVAAGLEGESLAMAQAQLATHLVGAKTGRIHPLVPDFLEPHVFSTEGWETGKLRDIEPRVLSEPPFDADALPSGAAPVTIDQINRTRPIANTTATVSIHGSTDNQIGGGLSSDRIVLDGLNAEDYPIYLQLQVTGHGVDVWEERPNGDAQRVGPGSRTVRVTQGAEEGTVNFDFVEFSEFYDQDGADVAFTRTAAVVDDRVELDLDLFAPRPADGTENSDGLVRVSVRTFTGLAFGEYTF
ncbi:MAG: DUF4214 domain-containing protein [Myxococcota bacterium]